MGVVVTGPVVVMAPPPRWASFEGSRSSQRRVEHAGGVVRARGLGPLEANCVDKPMGMPAEVVVSQAAMPECELHRCCCWVGVVPCEELPSRSSRAMASEGERERERVVCLLWSWSRARESRSQPGRVRAREKIVNEGPAAGRWGKDERGERWRK